MSFSLYICALAITDTMALLIGRKENFNCNLVISSLFVTMKPLYSFRLICTSLSTCSFIFTGCRHLIILQHLQNPPGPFLYCKIWITGTWTSSLCSTLFILSMTFDRFYSIIRPHKAASFNTVKRAKITIVFIVLFSIIFNIPHLFITLQIGKQCVPFGNAMKSISGQAYYWVSLIINFFLPFVLLLIMNNVIIHTLRKRSTSNITRYESQDQGHGQTPKMKVSEKQIYITLLLVTFGFLILNAPGYAFFVYVMYADFRTSAYTFASYFLFNNAARQAYYTNYGINFFFYVITGKKFRSDLVKLFKCKSVKSTDLSVLSSSDTITKLSTVPSHVELKFSK